VELLPVGIGLEVLSRVDQQVQLRLLLLQLPQDVKGTQHTESHTLHDHLSVPHSLGDATSKQRGRGTMLMGMVCILT
jgi:hypothetical protein